ncbi:PAS domain-containing hybrid sensor histidine kinase/response regulator [Roseibium sediminis]|uniref:PAS domain-containing hybrid sensor histidine kinase/response regulator n=1 Tax=Roseibium sediminis TaxID=1775174 RepID=UPI001AD8FD2F|nr:PAS domain-containing hybrid sensor histidine kinase/response regulator [Roseibium sediminis]
MSLQSKKPSSAPDPESSEETGSATPSKAAGDSPSVHPPAKADDHRITSDMSSETELDQAPFPRKVLHFLAITGMLAGVLAAFFFLSAPSPLRLFSVAAAFFAGGLAVWRLMEDDMQRSAAATDAKDDKIRRLMDRCEELEDRMWELRESDERQASILGTLGDVIIRRDTNGEIVYANAAARETFGDASAPRIGEPFSLAGLSVLPETTGSEPKQTGSTMGFGDLQLKTVRGERWFSRLDSPVRDAITQQPLVQTVLRDVTDRRMIEEELLAARHSAESSNEAKSRFLATVSHEIRTPLNGILGMATLLRDTRLTKEQIAYIEALETSGETLLFLIDEVLDFSKVEAGKLDIQKAPTRLSSLADSVVELLAPKAHAKGLEIGSRLDPALPDVVTVDATRVRQILFNLAGNGVKFTDEGGISIEIDGTADAEGGSLLKIRVRDTGIGFDEKEADRLFEEFEQVDHGPARKFGGTGLGLAIAQRLTKLMGGDIRASAVPNGGAQFEVTLPIPEALRDPADDAKTRYKGRHVLLIGTKGVECRLIADRLRQQGANADICAPGADGLDDLLAATDLVLVSNACVEDSGAWIATARLAGCDAPAVVMISPSERERLQRLRQAGYGAYVIRPVRSETLEHVVSGLLENNDADRLWDAEVTYQEGGSPGTTIRQTVRPLKLLVAEDNDINRLLCEALLRKLGHEAVMVADGESAVAAAAQEEFDLILTDLHMPGLDGLEAMRQIRIQEEALGKTPVPFVIVSADVMEDAREKARDIGALGYITKPLTEDAIQTALLKIAEAKPA